MNFLHILAIFAVLTVTFACVRMAQYQCQSRRWRREHRNFRILRAEDVVRFAIPKSVVLTSMAWITVADPIIALLLAVAIMGHKTYPVLNT